MLISWIRDIYCLTMSVLMSSRFFYKGNKLNVLISGMFRLLFYPYDYRVLLVINEIGFQVFPTTFWLKCVLGLLSTVI